MANREKDKSTREKSFFDLFKSNSGNQGGCCNMKIVPNEPAAKDSDCGCGCCGSPAAAPEKQPKQEKTEQK